MYSVQKKPNKFQRFILKLFKDKHLGLLLLGIIKKK